MHRRIRWLSLQRVVITIIAVVAVGCIYIAIKPKFWPTDIPPKVDATGVPSLPVTSTPVAPLSSSTVTSTPTPSNTTTDKPMPTQAPSPTKPVVPKLTNPRGKPKEMSIFQGGSQLVGMEVQKNGTAKKDDFESECGKTTWYSASGWPTPGTESLQRSLITGHMRCGGEVYSINDLKQSRTGALLKVTYDGGCVVVARATMNATNVKKDTLNITRNYLYNKELARIIRVSTCDDEATKDAQGHSTQNVFQMFEVVSVTCPS